MIGTAHHRETIGFGGGCHWCTEAVFQALKGVSRVEQGFIRSKAPAESWSEAVIVHFDPVVIDMAVLIEVHLRTHAATKRHTLRDKYRSAVYTFNHRQSEEAGSALRDLQRGFEDLLITEVLPFAGFKRSDERFQHYYQSNPERPFCKRYIDPKLDLLRRDFAAQMSG